MADALQVSKLGFWPGHLWILALQAFPRGVVLRSLLSGATMRILDAITSQAAEVRLGHVFITHGSCLKPNKKPGISAERAGRKEDATVP